MEMVGYGCMEINSAQRILEIADAIRLTFSMILTDRCHEDHKPPQPGIPRAG
jgi:hypothetical protein